MPQSYRLFFASTNAKMMCNEQIKCNHFTAIFPGYPGSWYQTRQSVTLAARYPGQLVPDPIIHSHHYRSGYILLLFSFITNWGFYI